MQTLTLYEKIHGCAHACFPILCALIQLVFLLSIGREKAVSDVCHLIIDSCCDLPYDLVQRDDVSLVRFPYLFGEEEHLDDLWQSASAKDFYGRMRKGEQPTTSQATIAELTARFVEAAELGTPSVYLCFSSGLSASYDQACIVAEQVRAQYPDFELQVVDTHHASVSEALFVFEALRQIDRGLSAAELAEWALEAQYYVNVYFMVEDLECLHRGGRIPSTVAVMGSKLDVKPILMIPADGTLTVKSVARGRKKGLRQLAQIYADMADKPHTQQYLVVGNADCEKDMKKLVDMIKKDCAKEQREPVFIETTIGPTIGSHVGPGMVAIAFWGPDRRDKMSVADRIAKKVRGARE